MTPTSPALLLTHVVGRLQQARQRVASGWPSVALALAGPPTSTAQARLAEAEDARHAPESATYEAQVLTDALAYVDEARALWGSTPDAMPPASSNLATCAAELRLHLATAHAAAGLRLAWEDPDGLTRGQGLCVVHLAVCLAQWRARELHAETAAAQAQAALEHERRQRATVAAKAIWGGQPTREPAKEPRSLRDLAAVSSAFDVGWDESETGDVP